MCDYGCGHPAAYRVIEVGRSTGVLRVCPPHLQLAVDSMMPSRGAVTVARI